MLFSFYFTEHIIPSFHLDDCRTIQFREGMKNMALINHIIKRYQGVNKEMCELKCYLEPNCVSYNYGPLNDELSVCELSDTHHSQVSSSELESRDHFIYRSIYKVRKLYHMEK